MMTGARREDRRGGRPGSSRSGETFPGPVGCSLPDRLEGHRPPVGGAYCDRGRDQRVLHFRIRGGGLEEPYRLASRTPRWWRSRSDTGTRCHRSRRRSLLEPELVGLTEVLGNASARGEQRSRFLGGVPSPCGARRGRYARALTSSPHPDYVHNNVPMAGVEMQPMLRCLACASLPAVTTSERRHSLCPRRWAGGAGRANAIRERR